jgi:hypothetical protein
MSDASQYERLTLTPVEQCVIAYYYECIKTLQ